MKITLTYSGNVASIVAPGGQTTTVEIDPDTGYATKIVQPAGGQVINVIHDEKGLLKVCPRRLTSGKSSGPDAASWA